MKKFQLLLVTLMMALAVAASAAMMPGDSGTMPGDSGMMSGDPGTMPVDPGTMPTDPGTMPGDSGMMSGDPGTMPGDPGTAPINMAPMMEMTMPMPTHQQMFSFDPVDSPVTGADVTASMPIGVGSVAMGGDMLTVHAAMGEFAGPMDMYLGVYAPAVDPFNIYLMHEDGSLVPASMGMAPWRSGVTGVDEVVLDGMPTSMMTRSGVSC